MQEHDSKRFKSLRHFEFEHPDLKKFEIAARLGVRPSRYSQLRDPRYRTTPNESELVAIATLLNQSPSYVRKIYSNAA